MKIVVYMWAKEGEEPYSSTRCPGEEYRAKLVKKGWEFFSIEVDLPTGEENIERLGRDRLRRRTKGG